MVVLTHDERLREHLMAQASSCDLYDMTRDVEGVVRVTPGRAAWELLLDDARGALALDAQHLGAGRTDVVRGLCRMAVDDACRVALHAHAAGDVGDTFEKLLALDQANTTRKRLRHLVEAYPETTLAQRAQKVTDDLSAYLEEWNRAHHGNEPRTAVVAAEVTQAEGACRHLVGSP